MFKFYISYFLPWQLWELIVMAAVARADLMWKERSEGISAPLSWSPSFATQLDQRGTWIHHTVPQKKTSLDCFTKQPVRRRYKKKRGISCRRSFITAICSKFLNKLKTNTFMVFAIHLFLPAQATKHRQPCMPTSFQRTDNPSSKFLPLFSPN